MGMIPIVIENDGKGERSFDIYSRLLRDRIIFVNGEVEENMAAVIVAELLFLDSEDHEKPIHMYIQSPGGACTAGFSIIDTMNLISAPVYTYCVGMCASMGAMIFSQGEIGHRYMLSNAECMIHQPLGGAKGQCTDIQIAAQNIQKTKERLYNMLADASGKTYEEIQKDCERDFWMNAQETVEYGLADSVLPSKQKKKV
jgi:ATP-dependent Clp protease protease subunit